MPQLNERALSREREKELLIDHETGHSAPALARRYKISERTVRRILADYQVQRTLGNKNAYRKSGRRTSKPRVVQPCGTEAAYRRHKRKKEYSCDECLAAHVDYNRK